MSRPKQTSTLNDRTLGLRRIVHPPSAAVVLAVVVFAAISVFLSHHVTLWLEAHPFKAFPDSFRPQLELFGYIAQDGVVITLFLILGWIAKGYTEPFFILWLFGWLSWIFMYSLRVYPLLLPDVHAGLNFHPDYIDLASDVFNGIHSYFFLVAGTVLIAPTRLSTRIAWRYPGRALATTPFVGPSLWLINYLWLNPIILAPLVPLMAPYLIYFFERAAKVSEPRLLNYSRPESIFSIVAITILAWGLHRRFSRISAPAALAAVVVHVLYIEPQLAKIIYGDTAFSTKGLGYVFDVLAPTIILKPALALFVAFLALRETDHLLVAVLEKLPDACLRIRALDIIFLNQRAKDLFGQDLEGRPVKDIFASLRGFDDLVERLRARGRILGHHALVALRDHTQQWVRIDALRTNDVTTSTELTDDIVLLVLDRHEAALAHAVYSFVHDYFNPRVRRLATSLSELSRELIPKQSAAAEALVGSDSGLSRDCSQLLGGMDRLSEEFREYWEFQKSAGRGALLEECLTTAVAAARLSYATLTPHPPEIVVGRVSQGLTVTSLDPNSLTRALQNVITNAMKHGRNPIEIAVSDEASSVLISIRDSGFGFPDRVIEFMNSPEGVGDQSVGMGLMTLKLTVARAGGIVRVGTDLSSHGAWVQIRLPAEIREVAS